MEEVENKAILQQCKEILVTNEELDDKIMFLLYYLHDLGLEEGRLSNIADSIFNIK